MTSVIFVVYELITFCGDNLFLFPFYHIVLPMFIIKLCVFNCLFAYSKILYIKRQIKICICALLVKLNRAEFEG